jgi:hypothetical protein
MECPNFPTVPLREERRKTIILFYYLTFALMVPQIYPSCRSAVCRQISCLPTLGDLNEKGYERGGLIISSLLLCLLVIPPSPPYLGLILACLLLRGPRLLLLGSQAKDFIPLCMGTRQFLRYEYILAQP